MIRYAYIKKLPNGKYRVYSEKGKHMGTYDSMTAAKKRLQQIEFFKRKSNFIEDLTTISDNLDQRGLLYEANMIDDIIKQAVEMSPEEYERYYGKSQPNVETIKQLDISTPEGYKRYFGKEMPKSEKPNISTSPKQTNYAVGDEIVVINIPQKYQLYYVRNKPALGEILKIKQIEPNGTIIAGREWYEFQPTDIELFKERPDEINFEEWQIKLKDLIQDLINTEQGKEAVLSPRLKISSSTAIIASLRFKTARDKNLFLKSIANLKNYRPTSPGSQDHYVAYYDKGYVWIRPVPDSYDGIYIIISIYDYKDGDKVKQVLEHIMRSKNG